MSMSASADLLKSSLPTEVKLIKDENWKRIQQNTFTRWVNKHLLKNASGSLQVANLETDLADGVILIKLAEVLSGKSLPRFNKKPNMRTQKFDNVSLVLRFLEQTEGIKIVNIDSSHIVDQNLKLILGLIWTLILHYSLSHHHIPFERRSSQSTESSVKGGQKSESPKQRLLAWIQAKLPHHPVNNFTSNWNDGITLAALVDACLAGQFKEWHDWDVGDTLANTQRAMSVAEQALGIEKLITPEELTNPKVDEKSVMTYLAQFPRAQPQSLGRIARLDRHPFIGTPCTFVLELEGKGRSSTFRPQLDILDPRGQALVADIRAADDSDNTFDDNISPAYYVTFVPKLFGEYKLTASIMDPTEPYPVKVPVDNAVVNAVQAPELVGLGSDAKLGQRHRFRLINVPDHHLLDVTVVDPEGREIVLDAGSERDEHSVVCCYTPKTVGTHLVNIHFNSRDIPGSPFGLHVSSDDSDTNGTLEVQKQHSLIAGQKDHLREPLIMPVIHLPPIGKQQQMGPRKHQDAIVWGRGLLTSGTCAGDMLAVHVDNCKDPVEVSVTKDGLMIPVSKLADVAHHDGRQTAFSQPLDAEWPRQTFYYIPRTAGHYEVVVKCDGEHLGNSPNKPTIGLKNLSSIRAVGPGLEGGIAEQKAVFYVDTHGRADYLEFTIKGPDKTEILCTDNGDGTATVEYTPHEPGRYTINITHMETGAHIRDSPFVIMVDPVAAMPFPSVKRPVRAPVAWTVAQPVQGTIGEPLQFSILHSNEVNLLDVDVYDPSLNRLRLDRRLDQASRANRFSFVPEKEGKHFISVVADKLAVAGWPHQVSVADPAELHKIWMYGPGLGPAVFAGQKTSFCINASQMQQKVDRVEVNLTQAAIAGQIVQHADIESRGSGLYQVQYVPAAVGEYKLNVLINGKLVYSVPVHATVRDLERHGHHATDYSSSPLGMEFDSQLKNISIGARMADEIPETVAGVNTAILFTCPPTNAGRVQHEPKAILKAPNGEETVLTLHHKNILGGDGVNFERIDSDKFRASFLPKMEGLYQLQVLKADLPIEQSPFKVPVAVLGRHHQAHLAWANGPGLAVGVAGTPNTFNVWNSRLLGGAGELTVTIDGPSKADVSLREHPSEENCCHVEYMVQQPGLYTISVCFNDAHISGSAFKVFVKPPTTESLSKTNSSASPAATELHHFDYMEMQTSYQPPTNGSDIIDSSYQDFNRNNLNFLHNGTLITEKEEHILSRKPEAVDGSALPKQQQAPVNYDGDARLVRVSGDGLSHFVPGQPSQFTVDITETGINTLFVGAVTSNGPAEEVNVSHTGGGKFLVSYTFLYHSEGLIVVKYGERAVPGSPFRIQPLHQGNQD